MVQLNNTWWVYLVKCADDSLYCGVTIDTDRRVSEHNVDNKKGAKYTKTRRPVELVFRRKCESRKDACQQEYQIKQLTRKKKLSLVASFSNNTEEYA
ncbi:MAG: GIY-YIG nuclease family protein [Saccharospirillaceae bacterium]|nr:GIY-YIG nuclease family protein [Pseudomonadales bacterium]NRB80456.1 GIY-YIG nuclease family protein [Saccharospirillaceae bacterium]